MKKDKKNKVLVIGLDGASPGFLFYLANKGFLPTLQGIMAEGFYGKLKSTVPPLTGPAWVSSVTGVNMGKHGIPDFHLSFDIKKRRILFADSKKRKVDAIWNLLSNMRKSVVILNVPMTFPPEKINGAIVSGFLTPSLKSNFTYPRNLKDDLINLDYMIDIGDTMLDKILTFKSNKIKLLHEIREMIKKRLIVAKYLMKQFDWDLFMVVFIALDRIQHLFWKFLDVNHIEYREQEARLLYPHLFECYLDIDKAIKSLLDLAGKNTNTLIYSDHGFRSLNRTFFTNNFLRRRDFLRIKKDVGKTILPSQESSVKLIYRLGLSNILSKISPEIKRKIGFFMRPSKKFLDIFDVDIDKTKAIQLGYNYIKIHKKILSDEEYERIKSALIDIFNKEILKSLSIKAFKKEDLYHGAAMEIIPDIILMPFGTVTPRQIIPTDGSLIMNYKNNCDIPSLMWNGDHDLYGIVMGTGLDFHRGLEIDGATILDIAPNIFHALNIPIPQYFDGRILIDIFKYK